jgi:hypothetical protein
MNISKIMYLFIALIGFSSCFGVPNRVQTVISYENDIKNLNRGLPPRSANSVINIYQARGLTREQAIQRYFTTINVPEEIALITEDIELIKADFDDIDRAVYEKLKNDR